MKPTTRAFLAAETLDCLTTIIGLEMGGLELNPLPFGRLLAAKVIISLCVAVILQKKTPRRADWAVPIAAWLVVPWNILNILTIGG